MVETKVGQLKKIDYKSITWFIGLTLIASILPQFIHNQFVTGPIINATLFLAAYYLGSGSAILVGLLPSIAALSSGLLPLPLAPMVPFIMISNAVLIVVFDLTRKINFGAGAIVASLAKYLFLYLTASFIVSNIMPATLAGKIALTMMAWPQLVTAFAGALIAFAIIRLIKKEVNE